MFDDRKVKIVTFVIKFDCQGSMNDMFEVKFKEGSRVRRMCCIIDYEFCFDVAMLSWFLH